MGLIKAVQKGEELLRDIHSASDSEGMFHLWWLGQSGFLLKWKQQHLLIDPYLSDSLTFKYAETDKPHIRMCELVVAPQKLDFIDIVTSSHNHTDHLDGDTLKPILEHNPGISLIVPEANRDFVVQRLKTERGFPIGLNEEEEWNGKEFVIRGVPAAHNQLDRDIHGRCRFMGYLFQFGDFSVYHSGDTMWHDAIINSLSPFRIDVAILPINGHKPERRVAGNLNASEAVRMGTELGVECVIPCHYHMFTFNTEDPDNFVREAEANNLTFEVLELGERWTYHGRGK